MLPEELSLRGFLSYRKKQTLDFTKFHVALISGDNGQGKSSLLEAMTFALYGIARGVEKNRSGIGDLVSDGENFLEVIFRFKQAGKTYRIVRAFNKVKNSSDVRLEILRSDGFVNLSEGSIRETDRKIREIIGMDYDAFVTSSFIMQGRADFFTRKKESEKIEILRQILGLELYENARELANEKIKLITREIEARLDERKAIEEEISQRPTLEDKKRAVSDKKKTLLEKKKVLDKAIEKLQKDLTHLNVLRETLRNNNGILSDSEKALSEKKALLASLKEKHTRFEAVLKNEAEILKGYDAFLRAREELTELLNKKSLTEQKKREKESLENRIKTKRSLIESKIENAKKALQESEEIIKSKQSEVLNLDKEISALEKTLSETQSGAESAEESLNALEERIEKVREDLQKKDKSLSEVKRIKSLEEERKQALKKEVASIEKRINALKKEKEKVRSAITLPYETLTEEVKTLSEKLDLLSKKRENLLQLLTQTKSDLAFVKNAISETEEKVSLLSSGESRCPLCGSPLTEEHLKELLVKFETEKAELREKQKALSEKAESLRKEIDKLEKETKNLLNDKKALEGKKEDAAKLEEKLSALDKQIEELNSEREKRLSNGASLSEEEQNALKNYMQIAGEISISADDLKSMEAQYKTLAQKRTHLQKKLSSISGMLSARKEALKNAKEQIAISEKRKSEAEKALQELSALLKNPDFMKDEKAQIKKIEGEIERIGFSEESLKSARSKAEKLKIFEEQYRALTDARSHISEIKEQIALTEKETRQLTEKINSIKEKIAQLNEEVKSLAGVEDALSQKKKEKQTLDEEIKTVVSEEAKLVEKLSEIERKEKRFEELKKEVVEKEETVQILNACKKMFGKEGIQISIIRDAIPQIEGIANEMLSRMTNGRMNLKFDTLRQLKTRDISKSTLRISVYDNGEKRRYELFSGGEQFRINLAIRIGISMFLSERSGMPLEMLVIDEGFGSQDENGKMRILEEINSFKDRFKKIIIITHVSDIKENFPYEIRVVKDETGSHLTIM